jgi:hypothetical protein
LPKILKIINNKITKIKVVNHLIRKDKKKRKEEVKINGSWRIFQEVDNILDVNLIELIIKTLNSKIKTVIFANFM